MSGAQLKFKKSRRRFNKRMAAGAAVGLSASLLIGVPKKAHAVFWEIPAAVLEFFNLSKEYYERYIEEWVDKVKELKDYYNDDNPIVPAVLTVTDAANFVRTKIENSRRKRELEPNPSDHCAGQNIGKGKNIMHGVRTQTGVQRTKDTGAALKLLVNDGNNYQYQLRKEINENIESKSLEETLESLNGNKFVGNRGYDDAEHMELYIKSVMARARYIISQYMGKNARTIAFGGTLLSRLSIPEDALNSIFIRRVPTKVALEQAKSGALPYERSLLDKLSTNDGISTVDLENFESKRTHQSMTWQKMVEDSASATAMLKEFNLLQAASNDLDHKILEVQSQINEVKAARAISETEMAGKDN